MSERVRKARALDAVEKVVERCCGMAVEAVECGATVQMELKYDIIGAVEDAAELYGVDAGWLAKEAMWMLRNGLNVRLRPVCEVRYVKPYTRDGWTVGMETRVYRFDRKVA